MLVWFALFSELVYLFLFAKASEFGLLDLHNDQHVLWVVVSLLLLFVGYFSAYFFIRWQRVSIRDIFFVVLLFHTTFLFIPFLSSNDLYSYIFTGRVFSIWGQNPYLVPYSQMSQDVLYSKLETVWAHHTVLYGPLFIYISGLINLVGQNNLAVLVYLFKLTLLGINVFNVFLIYRLTKSKEAVFLYGLNPLVIYELAGNGHTESLIILFLLVSFTFLKRDAGVGFIVFIVSVLIKYYTLLFIPFYLIYLKKQGLKKLVFSLALGLVVVVLAYWPLWEGFSSFDYLFSFYNGQYVSPSLFVYLGQIVFGSYRLSFQINTVIFLAFVGVLVFKFWFSSAVSVKELFFYSFLVYFAYILTKSSLVLAWYLIPLVALGSLCISFKECRRYVLSGMCFVSIYSLVLYYFVR